MYRIWKEPDPGSNPQYTLTNIRANTKETGEKKKKTRQYISNVIYGMI